MKKDNLDYYAIVAFVKNLVRDLEKLSDGDIVRILDAVMFLVDYDKINKETN